MDNIREPKQKRAIEKKEKIIEAGFKLICENGYYNTNTALIAKEANVSTGILYQYFNDKHDIFIEGINKYGDEIFFPMLKIDDTFDIKNFDNLLKNAIKKQIKKHRLSKIAHEEIMSMTHSDDDVRNFYYKRELEMTENIKNILINSGFKDNNLNEKVHITIGLIDNLCHEVIYHNHKNMNYDVMMNIIIDTIKNIFKNDLFN